MKKILFVVNVDWFFISHRLPIALEAINRGYKVYLACGVTDKKEYLESLGIIVYPLSLSRSSRGLYSEIKTFFEIFNILKKTDVDITHFVTIKPILYGGISSRFLAIKKRVFSIAGLGYIFIANGLKASISRFFITLLYKIALGGKDSTVIIQNEDDRDVILKMKNNIDTRLIRGSGVDLQEYKYIKRDLKKIKIVMASRLLKDKGVFEYNEAAKIIKTKGYDVDFELYGDIDIHNLASLTKDDVAKIAKDGFVKLYGFSDNIAKVFGEADIVVLPSYREGLPKVLVEAAACGRAVVTTDVVGCRDAIEIDVSGLLAKVKDSNSLAQKIEILLNDKELIFQMGKSGRELAQREFDVQMVIEKHFEIYGDKI